MASQEAFGRRLRRLRQQSALSQTQLAGAGMSPSYISLLEAGKRAPTQAVIQRLAERLGCDPQLLTEGVRAVDAAELELQLRYAELALQSGEAAEAAERFRMLVIREGQTPESVLAAARWGHARALEAAGEIEAAIAAYEELRQEAEARPSGLPWLPCVIALCRCYREVGDLTRSIELGEHARARVAEYGLAGTDLEVEAPPWLVPITSAATWSAPRLLADQVIETAERLGSATRLAFQYAAPRALAPTTWAVRSKGFSSPKGALALYAQGEDARNLSRLRTAYAGWLLRQDPPRPIEARPLLEAAAAQLADRGSEVDLSYVETELARAELLLGSPDLAVDMAQQALGRLDPQRAAGGRPGAAGPRTCAFRPWR